MAEFAFELDDVSLFFNTLKRRSLIFSTSQNSKYLGKRTITALDHLNLKIESGHTIGLIGRNGSGKTTLMRLLAGIYAPDAGSLKSNSDSIVLLSLGVGFDNNLTGYENIFIASLLNGLRESEVNAKLDQIIDFAGLGDFIYAPLKTYSTGMRSRLAFSIAVNCDPEVLLIDEILSVGDEEFREKSKNRLAKMINDKNKTVLIASHSMESIKEMCDEVIWLEKGRIKMIGEPKTVTQQYVKSF